MSNNVVSDEEKAAMEARVERVSRAFCIARNIDPDFIESPYAPGHPAWHFFRQHAFEFILMHDAASG